MASFFQTYDLGKFNKTQNIIIDGTFLDSGRCFKSVSKVTNKRCTQMQKPVPPVTPEQILERHENCLYCLLVKN